MADYTIELRKIRQQYDECMQDYPIFSEDYREILNEKIFKHYKYREIGFETVDMFCDRLATRMGEIMPLMNQLYESAALEFDPLSSIDMWHDTTSDTTSDTLTRQESQSDETTDSSSTNASDSKTTNYEFPQTFLAGNEDYATNASHTQANGDGASHANQVANATADNTGHATNSATSQSHQHGRGEPAADMIARWRSIMINPDIEVINQLSDLFMSLFSQSLQFTHRGGLYGYLY